MGRLFAFAIALAAFGIAMSGTRPPAGRTIPVAAAPAEAASPPVAAPIAYRPGEPQLVPGQATTLQRAANGHFTAATSVNGQPVDMVVDTGATSVALTVDDARRLGIAVDPASFQVVGTGASGPVRGMAVTLADVGVEGRHVAAVRGVVLEGLDRSLLGQSYLRRLDQVEISGDTMTLR